MSEESLAFPVGRDFLTLTQELANTSSKEADKFCAEGGERLPQTIDALGTVLSFLYRLACCYYGCRGGDHQVEWLAGKFVNQAVSVYLLVRAAQYDEALMLIRGMGEIANLFWLFQENRSGLAAWKSADKKERQNRFGPGAVRRQLKKLNDLGPPIDDDRYAALCEVATHPTPSLAPGHYSGTGRPVLGAILQEVGVFVCINELAYAVAMAAIPIAVLLDSESEIKTQIKDQSVRLLRAVGSFTVLNYEEGLREAYEETPAEMVTVRPISPQTNLQSAAQWRTPPVSPLSRSVLHAASNPHDPRIQNPRAPLPIFMMREIQTISALVPQPDQRDILPTYGTKENQPQRDCRNARSCRQTHADKR